MSPLWSLVEVHSLSPGSETRLPFSGDLRDIYEVHGDQRVDLRHRNNANMPSGIYRCSIPTSAIHNDSDCTVRESVYATGGKSEMKLLMHVQSPFIPQQGTMGRCVFM